MVVGRLRSSLDAWVKLRFCFHLKLPSQRDELTVNLAHSFPVAQHQTTSALRLRASLVRWKTFGLSRFNVPEENYWSSNRLGATGEKVAKERDARRGGDEGFGEAAHDGLRHKLSGLHPRILNLFLLQHKYCFIPGCRQYRKPTFRHLHNETRHCNYIYLHTLRHCDKMPWQPGIPNRAMWHMTGTLDAFDTR